MGREVRALQRVPPAGGDVDPLDPDRAGGRRQDAQDGRFSLLLGKRRVDCRVSAIPCRKDLQKITIRFLDKQEGSQFSWETAQWVDRHAINTGATQVRIDSNGIGEGVYGELCRLAAEHGRYIVIGMKGQSASPNKHQWRNARAYWWDNTRTEMRLGKIDLDPDDDILTDELVSVLYAYDDNTLGTGGLLIESKISMRKRGVKSPDYADAFMYACADLSDIVGSPLAGLRNGDTVMIEDEQPAWAVFGW